MSPTTASSTSAQSAEKGRQILQTLTQLEKQFGKGSIQRLGSRNAQAVTTISSGSISIDAAIVMLDVRGLGKHTRKQVLC